MRHIILGTAGHIDHGKSALVKALTGVDPDRLKEEKERGITIDIGFADLVYAESGLTVGIVDVPGHERLVRNMLAGAGGIDMVLLVIAADEGIMPQSREHLSICNLLKIKSGLIAVTKTDLVEKEWLELVEDEVRNFVKGTFLQDAPIIPVSSRTGENLDLLKKEIESMALRVTPKTSDGLFRLPLDRVFTLKGFGTVVTGTALSGKISVDEPVIIMPSDIRTKVRGLHSHGRSIQTAYAGQRVAINLQGVEKEELRRGDIAVTSPDFSPTKTIDAFLELINDSPVVKNKSLVHFYSGTSETIARVIIYGGEELSAGQSGYCQLRLQDPVIVMSGDHFIIRRFSPLETLGGGEILDPAPPKKRRRNAAEELETLHKGGLDGKVAYRVENAGKEGVKISSLRVWINAELKLLDEATTGLIRRGDLKNYDDVLMHSRAVSMLKSELLELLGSFHKKNPLRHGMPKEEARNQLRIDPAIFNSFLEDIKEVVAEKNLLRLKSFKIALSSDEETYRKNIIELLQKARFQPPSKEELAAALKVDAKHMSDIMGILVKEGSVVRISESLYMAAGAYDEILSLLKSFFTGKSEMSVAEFRDLLGTSRKYALPVLEFLDSHKVTMRVGDSRKLLMRS